MEQVVRDLMWTIRSPSLLRASQDVYAVADTDAEFELSVDQQQKLVAFVAERQSRRVGYYFEDLVQFWLEHVCEFEIVASQQQMRVDKRTIGEVDFIFRDREGKLIHLETAVKFYLHYPIENESGSFLIGPNAADNFEKKTRRLFEHQLPLSKQFFPDVDQRLAFVKGRIFYRARNELTSDSTDIANSPQLATDHLRATWLYASELESLELPASELKSLQPRMPQAQYRFRVQPKPHWLSNDEFPVNKTDAEPPADVFSFVQLCQFAREHFASRQTPFLTSVLQADELNSGSTFRETDRMFVVPNFWPQVATAR